MATMFAADAMTVLVATTDAIVRRRLCGWLAAAGHLVLEADGAAVAYRAIAGKPDVIVLDWLVGETALRRLLRALEQRHRHFAVVYCAEPRPFEITAIFAAGADDFIDAAAPREELVARIAGWTRRRA
jgi:DNA-binding response OmpR family regulator